MLVTPLILFVDFLLQKFMHTNIKQQEDKAVVLNIKNVDKDINLETKTIKRKTNPHEFD